MKIFPIGTKILIEKLPRKQPKSGAIILKDEPDNYLATIISIAIGVKHSELKVGDIIKYAPYGVNVVDSDQPNLILIDEKDVLCVVGL